MPAQCVAWNCNTRRRGDELDDQTITFHSFPINRPALLSEWLAQMGEATWKPQRGSVLCSKHFDKSCFLQNYAQPRLKQNAVPTYFEKRHSLVPGDLDKQAAVKEDAIRREIAAEELRRPRKRKLPMRPDPEEEVNKIKEMLIDERIKRKELELEIYKLRQEKSEMAAKMNKLESSKCRPNIPQNLIPIIVDAMAKGIDPLKKMENRGVKRAIQAVQTKSVAPAQQLSNVNMTPTTSCTAANSKLVLQLPQQFLNTNSSKTVSFLVPVSGAGTTTTTTPSKPDAGEVVTVE